MSWFLSLSTLVLLSSKQVLSSPQVNLPMNSQSIPRIVAGEEFEFIFSKETFKETSKDARISYAASGLPKWLKFTPQQRKFQGTSPKSAVGVTVISVSAKSSSGKKATDSFNLVITPAQGKLTADGPSLQYSLNLFAV